MARPAPGKGEHMVGHADPGRRRLSDPFLFDKEFLTSQCATGGDLRLAGADEVGRGSLAGPLVAAAVVLDYSIGQPLSLAGLTDSKLLTSEARERIYRGILCTAKRVCWTAVSASTVDRVGLHRCNLMALCRVLESCCGEYGFALVDGFELNRPDLRANALVRGDYKSAAVGAASVVAKVVRDRLMRGVAALYPEYGFETHVGYGTDVHRQALRAHGPCRLHRLSFQGVGCSQLELWQAPTEDSIPG
jgi:ribonuclease HII